MADVSQIKIGNTTYNIKDTTARANSLPDHSSASEGDVLTINWLGNVAWGQPSGGVPSYDSASAGDVLTVYENKGSKYIDWGSSGGGGGGSDIQHYAVRLFTSGWWNEPNIGYMYALEDFSYSKSSIDIFGMNLTAYNETTYINDVIPIKAIGDFTVSKSSYLCVAISATDYNTYIANNNYDSRLCFTYVVL